MYYPPVSIPTESTYQSLTLSNMALKFSKLINFLPMFITSVFLDIYILSLGDWGGGSVGKECLLYKYMDPSLNLSFFMVFQDRVSL